MRINICGQQGNRDYLSARGVFFDCHNPQIEVVKSRILELQQHQRHKGHKRCLEAADLLLRLLQQPGLYELVAEDIQPQGFEITNGGNRREVEKLSLVPQFMLNQVYRGGVSHLPEAATAHMAPACTIGYWISFEYSATAVAALKWMVISRERLWWPHDRKWFICHHGRLNLQRLFANFDKLLEAERSQLPLL